MGLEPRTLCIKAIETKAGGEPGIFLSHSIALDHLATVLRPLNGKLAQIVFQADQSATRTS